MPEVPEFSDYLVFVDESGDHNLDESSAGLQLTDLMARPVALHHLRPGQPNRAFEIIERKLRRGPTGTIEGWGLKRLP